MYANHAVFCFLNRITRAAVIDELLFIPFRPVWLRPQQLVYRALHRIPCEICMYEYYPEFLTKQHISTHPPICKLCYDRLDRCPFCRTRLHSTNLARCLFSGTE